MKFSHIRKREMRILVEYREIKTYEFDPAMPQSVQLKKIVFYVSEDDRGPYILDWMKTGPVPQP